jgi:hypothetical protein
MSRCEDKRFKLLGLYLPSGTVFTLIGTNLDTQLTVRSGRDKPHTGDVGAVIKPSNLKDALINHVVDSSDAVAFVETPNGVRFTLTPEIISSGPLGSKSHESLRDVLNYLSSPEGLTTSVASMKVASNLAASQLYESHSKSVSGNKRLEVLDKFLPSGLIQASKETPSMLASLDESSRKSRLSNARATASKESWLSALREDPKAVLSCPESLSKLPPSVWMASYCSHTERPLVNLTPHDINIINTEGLTERTYSSDGIARASQSDEHVGIINGIPVVRTVFGDPTGFPPSVFDPQSSDVFIVSKITADAAVASGINPDKLLLITETVVNEEKQIEGARKFATAPPSSTVLSSQSPTQLPETAEIVNLTSRPVIIVDPNTKEEILNIPSSSIQALASQRNDPAGYMHGQPVVRVVYGNLENAPEPKDGVFYVVSAIAAAAAPHRRDFLLTSRPVRDDQGRIIASSALAIP